MSDVAAWVPSLGEAGDARVGGLTRRRMWRGADQQGDTNASAQKAGAAGVRAASLVRPLPTLAGATNCVARLAAVA